MKKMSKMILAAMLVAAGLVGKADATIVISTQAYVATTVLLSTPTATGVTIRLKGCMLANKIIPVLDTCVDLIDMTAVNTIKATVCVPKNQVVAFPSATTGPGNGIAGTAGSLSQFFGEDMVFSGAFAVASSTPTGTGITLTCSYSVK